MRSNFFKNQKVIIIIKFVVMISDDQQRIVFSMISLIFLSYPIRLISSKSLRYWYSFLLGTALQIYVYRKDILVILIQHFIVYALLKLKLKRSGAIITIQSLVYLSAYQIYEIYTNYGGWVMDGSALLMIQVCKYSLLAYACQDGAQPLQKLKPEAAQLAVNGIPNFWDYANYLQFLPSSVIGPVLQYRDFKKFMELQKPYTQVANPISTVLITFLQSLVFISIHFGIKSFFPDQYLKTPTGLTDNPFYIIFYAAVVTTGARFKYYFAWKLSESAVHSSGISYIPEHQSNKFDRIVTCNPFIVETSIHIRDKISNWNIPVQQWLRKSVYQRSPLKNRMHSQLFVFMVSAFWHGFYPGYYISFLLWFLQVHLQGLIFKFTRNQNNFIRIIYQKLGIVGYILLSVVVLLLFSSNAVFFVILDFKMCFQMLSCMYFIPQASIFIGIFIFTVWKPRVPKDKQRKE